jgi:hypothetical protein
MPRITESLTTVSIGIYFYKYQKGRPMKPEEIAVLRILYKHNGPLKYSALIEGFPDESRSCIVDAVSRLQVLSYLNMIDCSSVLYVGINRHMKRDVMRLLEYDSEKYIMRRVFDHEIRSWYHRDHTRLSSPNPNVNSSSEHWLRIPKRSVKIGTSVMVFSFVILGTITLLGSQSTDKNGVYSGNEGDASLFVTGSSSLATEMQNGETLPIEHNYDSNLNQAYSNSQPAIYEGIFTKLKSGPSSHHEPPLYYHYLISDKKGLLLLEQIGSLANSSDSNSSIFANSDAEIKEISST